MRLADLLDHQRHAVEERWLERVRPLAPRDGLAREELLGSLPAFLAELAGALRRLEGAPASSALPERSPAAKAHGQRRQRLGYATAPVAREYPLLHEVILEAAAAAGVAVSAREGVLLARCMSTAAAEALFPFASASEQAALSSEIAERSDAEARAEAERQKLHEIFEQAPVVIAIIGGPEYTFSFANPAYRRLVGGMDVVGKPLREALPGPELQGICALLDGVVASGIPYVGREVPMTLATHAPEDVQYFTFVYQPMRGPDGRVHSVLGCGYEVTDQVRARRQAEALAAQLEAILQAFPEAVYVADATGITRANAAGLSLLGAASVEEVSRDIAVLHERARVRRADTGEPLPPEENALALALQGRTGFSDIVVRDLSRGEDRVLHVSAAPVRVGGDVVGAVSICTEITERTLAEQALRERADFEEKLIGIVGHDLRQPLQTIAMAAGLLLRRPGLDERALWGVQRMTAAAARMQRMLRDILDFTRARLGGGIPIERAPGDVAQLAREAAEEVQLVHAGRHVAVAIEGSGEGRWDADRLRQVLDNLLTNALAYSPAGTPVRLEVDGRTPDAVHVRVHNAGAPIPAELLPVLFQPLTRGAGTGGAERSVGLGLFIVRHLVEAHGGRVEVASSEAEGTTFSMRLPRG